MRDGPVLAIGETLIDLIASDGADRLDEVNAFSVRAGGAPANAAVALARLGTASAFCGVVGADPFGDRLKRTLASHGVDVSRVRSTSDAETSIAYAWKDRRGDGHFRLLRMADSWLSEADVEAAGIPETAALVIGSVSLPSESSRRAVQRAAEIASCNGVPVCFDVNVRPTQWSSAAQALAACRPIFALSTLLKLSLDDGRALFPDVTDPAGVLEAIHESSARFVVITDGARGAWFADRSAARGLAFVPRFSVDAIEPTGAGDAFTAAVISRLVLSDWTLLTAPDVRYASAAGALTTMKPGAMDALPTRTEVERFLASV